MLTIKPGNYKLAQDIVNPYADKRVKYDWRAFPVLKKDTLFTVKSIEMKVKGEIIGSYSEIKATSLKGSYGVTEGELGELIAKNLVPIEEDTLDLFIKLNNVEEYQLAGTLKLLIEKKLVSLDVVKETYQEYMNSDVED